jgi:hypothetical protein
MPPAETTFDPTKPLRNPKWERFAREAVCLTEPLQAMSVAGFTKPRAGNAARLLRNRKIAATHGGPRPRRRGNGTGTAGAVAAAA